MRQWLLRAILLGVLLLLGFWAWHIFFPNTEKAIRRRLTEIAQLASCSSTEGALAKGINAEKLGSYCTADVTISMNLPGVQPLATGRDDVVKGALWARSNLAPISAQLSDIVVTLAPNKQSATADLTARVRASTDTDFYIQELRVRLKKLGGQWLVSRVDSIKTLR